MAGVEPGVPPGGKTVVSTGDGLADQLFPTAVLPGGRMPPSTAGETPATTHQKLGGGVRFAIAKGTGLD